MITYALIGDSQSAGLERGLRVALSIAFAEPHVGWMTRRIVSEGPLANALASSADVVLLVTGGNDDPGTALRAAIEALAVRTAAAGKKLIVVGPVFAKTADDVPARHDASRAAWIRALAAYPQVRWIDGYPLTRDLASTSNVHLTASKYLIYAQRLAAAVSARSSGGRLGAAVGLFVVWALWKTAA